MRKPSTKTNTITIDEQIAHAEKHNDINLAQQLFKQKIQLIKTKSNDIKKHT